MDPKPPVDVAVCAFINIRLSSFFILLYRSEKCYYLNILNMKKVELILKSVILY